MQHAAGNRPVFLDFSLLCRVICMRQLNEVRHGRIRHESSQGGKSRENFNTNKVHYKEKLIKMAGSGYYFYDYCDKRLELGKKCRTSRVSDKDGGNYEHYGSLSRGEELKFLLRQRARKSNSQNPGPSDSDPPTTIVSKCLANKTLHQPQINSSRFEAEAIKKAIADLGRVPEEVERAVRASTRTTVGTGRDNSKETKQLLREASRKLNIQPTTKIYRDLLEISITPEVNLKRFPQKEKKYDPVPVLEDYMQAQYTRIKPYNYYNTIQTQLVKKEKIPTSPCHTFTDDNSNDYDIIGMDRVFISE